MPREEEMAKGKTKNSSSDSVAPPQLRSLRSRKRQCPSDDISKTDHVQGIPHQDTDMNDTVEDATLTQCIRTPVQETTMTSVQQHQAAQQPLLNKEDPAMEGKHAEASIISLKHATAKAIDAQEETTLCDPSNDSPLKGLTTHTIQNGKDEEEITVEEPNRSPSQTRTGQLPALLKTPEECNGSFAPTFEEKPGAKENSQSALETNLETGPEECSDVVMALGLPAKKKRRMGMRDLTEKERSHSLRAQMHQNGRDGPASAEKQICNNTADLVVSSPPSPRSPFTPADRVTEQNEAESRVQPSYCEGTERAGTEGGVAVIISDGSSAACDPDYSGGKSCEAEGGVVPGPEQTDDSKSEPPTEEGLSVEQQQDLQGGAAEDVAENTREQMTDGADASPEGQSPANGLYSSPMPNEKTDGWDAPLQVERVTLTRDEEKEDLTFDTGDTDQATAGASSADTGERCPAQPCEAAVSPGGPERKDGCDPDNKAGACTAPPKTGYPQTRDATGPFGSANPHYVSDSQLNTITLIEEEVMGREEDLGSQNCHDATDLICGLITELSSLNRKVMATHRELENLRRSSKTSRSSMV